MQVSVEHAGGLERKLTVQVPAERLDKAVDERLQSMAKTVRLAGFRPGKVPLRVVRKRYGGQVRKEVMGELIQESYQAALQQEQLNPAGWPSIEPRQYQPGQDLEYVATFEVYPEIDLGAVEGLALERPVASVTEADVDGMIENLQRQRKQWSPAERAAATGDRVVIDFTGTLDGEAFEGGEAKEYALELGRGQTIPGFEENLEGVKAGDEIAFDVKFPDDYHSANLRGRPARFAVSVHRVEAAELPAVDEEFARGFGVQEGGVEGLRADIRRNMERELAQGLRTQLKRRVMDRMLLALEVPTPNALVGQEIGRLKEQMASQLQGQVKAADLPDDTFREEALRRVKLGLIVAEIVRQRGLKADPERVRAHVESMASAYEEPQKVVDYYYSRRELLESVEALVLEEQVVDWVIERGKVTDSPSSFDEVLNPRQSSGADDESTEAK